MAFISREECNEYLGVPGQWQRPSSKHLAWTAVPALTHHSQHVSVVLPLSGKVILRSASRSPAALCETHMVNHGSYSSRIDVRALLPVKNTEPGSARIL